MNKVFVLDANKVPLSPCHPMRARELLKQGKAAVYRMRPFTLILKSPKVMPHVAETVEVKLDPGSKTSGVVVTVNQDVVFAMNLQHHGQLIKRDLESRRAIRRGRRNRHTRYRKPRFMNRTRAPGWLPPSVQSRVDNLVSWVKKLLALCPAQHIHVEHVNFDMQKMQNPEISGVEYQRGTLYGVEVRQYLLEKFGRKCVYCGKMDVPLEIEHVIPKSRGGTNNISNLTLACHACNQKKAAHPVEEFLKDKPAVLRALKLQLKTPLKDAAAVNAMKNKLVKTLENLGVPVSKWSAGRTKFNRETQQFAKDHWIDAACVGASGQQVDIQAVKLLEVKATGRGNRQVTSVNGKGFPCSAPKKHKRIHGFSTGDLVKVAITRGKYIGNYVATLSGVRNRGSFSFKHNELTIDANHKNFKLLQRGDGYRYSWGAWFPRTTERVKKVRVVDVVQQKAVEVVEILKKVPEKKVPHRDRLPAAKAQMALF